MIRHAMAGETGNEVIVLGDGFAGSEKYKISSYNRTQNSFVVLLYAGEANGEGFLEVSIPSRIQDGKYYNNEYSSIDFRGEGFEDGMKYVARSTTKDLDRKTGDDQNVSVVEDQDLVVVDGKLSCRVDGVRKFTKILFYAQD